MKLKSALIFLFLVLTIVACDKSVNNDFACTEEFRGYRAVVVDQNGNLVTDLKVSFSDWKGDVTELPNSFDPFFNSYEIMTDNYTNLMSENPTPFYVKFTKGDLYYEQLYYFNTDKCKCHVNKTSGPDTVIINI